jgi:hypothetical protein
MHLDLYKLKCCLVNVTENIGKTSVSVQPRKLLKLVTIQLQLLLAFITFPSRVHVLEIEHGYATTLPAAYQRQRQHRVKSSKSQGSLHRLVYACFTVLFLI